MGDGQTCLCTYDVCMLCSDHRESHTVTKIFEVKQLETGDNHNDDNIDTSRSVAVAEVRHSCSV